METVMLLVYAADIAGAMRFVFGVTALMGIIGGLFVLVITADEKDEAVLEIRKVSKKIVYVGIMATVPFVFIPHKETIDKITVLYVAQEVGKLDEVQRVGGKLGAAVENILDQYAPEE